MNISEFAKSRAVDAQTVATYLRRHKIPYSRSEGLTDEAMELLDKQYPIPSDIIIRVKDEEAEQKLKEKEQELEEVKSQLDKAKDKIITLLEANEHFIEEVAKVLMLEDKTKSQTEQIDKLQQDIEERDKEIERLKNRGLIARLMNT